jgi:hypothetical protein
VQLSTYLQTLERVTPSRYNAILVYATDVREAAPLVARYSGQDTSTVVAALARFAHADFPTITTIERCVSADEVRFGGQRFTARLVRRASKPWQPCSVVLCVAPSFTEEAAKAMAAKMTGRERGVLVVRSVCPPEHKRKDTDRVPMTAASEWMSFDVLEVP